MVSAEQVFNTALALMNETQTSVYAPDLEEYRARAVSIINLLLVELYPYSESFEGSDRPVPQLIQSLTDDIDMDDGICIGILPYGLAAQLQFGEDNVRVSYNNQKYEELKASIARGMPQEFEPIEDVYGWAHNDFGAWG